MWAWTNGHPRWKALAATVFLWLTALRTAAHDEHIEVVREPLELLRPLLVEALPQYATRCYKVAVPKQVDRVKILASAVGLAGNPILHGGWEPLTPVREPAKEAGFQTLVVDEATSNGKPLYFICLRTFSAQGCSLILTVAALDAKSPVSSPLWLTPSHPCVWPLGKSWETFQTQRFLVPVAAATRMQISAVPVAGEASITVYANERCEGTAIAAKSSVPAVVSLSDESLKDAQTLCVEASGDGTVAVSAGPGSLGPVLAPAVPMVGLLKQSRCEPMRLTVHAGTDVMITGLAEDGSHLSLSASLALPLSAGTPAWTSETRAGGDDVVLEVSGEKVRKACQDAGWPQSTATLALSVCRVGSIPPSGNTLVWLTALTASSVTPLEDGLPQATVIPHSDSATWDSYRQKEESQWRDFRYLVPGGKDCPDFVTISGTTVGRASMVADTNRFPGDPSAFRWASSNSSTPFIRLTTKVQWKSDEVHLIDCRPPCFVYISGAAWTVGHPDRDTELKVTVSSERKTAISLVQDNAVTQRLTRNEMQTFSYDVLRKDISAIFTISTTEGSVEMMVSGDADFPQDISTVWASDAIILPPSAGPFRHAVSVAEKGKDPKLYVRARGTSEMPSTFSIVARSEGDAQVLHNGDEVHGAVVTGSYDRYRFYVGDDEIKNGPLNVTVQVSPVMGDPGLYISCQATRPDENNNDWGGASLGQDAIYFTSLSPRFKPGWIYISVAGGKARAAYGLRVEWGKSNVKLEDGTEEIGRCMKNDVRPYFLVVDERKEHDEPVAIRAQAWVGAISVCVAELDDEGGSDLPPAVTGHVDCKYRATADSSRLAEASGLAAIDIPAKDLRKGGRLALLVQGLHSTNAFSMRALVDAHAILTEGHDLLDSLGPACCVQAPAWEKLLRRRYRTFVRPVSGVTIKVHALGDGTLAGATLRARHYHGGSAAGEDVEKDGQAWLFSSHAPDSEKATSVLRIVADLSHHTNGATEYRDFWLEIELSVAQPVNYTMEIKTNGVHKVQRAQKQLLPSERINVRAISMEPETVQFALDPSAADGAWQLQVRQCYGRVTVALPYAPRFPSLLNGSDINLPLPTTGLQRNSGSINAAGAALFTPLTAPPVVYELMLKPPGTGVHESPIFFHGSPVLKQDPSKPLGFVFSAAEINDTRLHRNGMLAVGDEAALFYKLVAIPLNHTLLNANSTCGLMEAIKRKEAVTVKLAQGNTLDKRRLSAEFVDLKDEVYRVNVLVTLISQNGSPLAARSYESIVFDKRKVHLPNTVMQNKIMGGLILLGFLAAGCWLASSKSGSSRRFNGKESVEFDDPYELQEDFSGAGSSLQVSRSGRGKYEPPEMARLC